LAGLIPVCAPVWAIDAQETTASRIAETKDNNLKKTLRNARHGSTIDRTGKESAIRVPGEL
jgi:hypothetical protein